MILPYFGVQPLALMMKISPARTNPLIKLLPIAGIILLTGCYSVPFEQPEMVRLEPDVDPAEAADKFENRLPNQFVAENTLIFRFFWQEIAALGYAKVDRQARTFDVMCLNHLGVQLFHISGDQEGNHLHYAIPEFKEQPNFANAVGEDIRQIFFDLTPGEDAEAKIRRNRIVFRESTATGEVEFVFAGPELNLIEKRVVEDSELERKIFFYEYMTEPEFTFPGGVILHNPRQRYRLIIKNRDITLD